MGQAVPQLNVPEIGALLQIGPELGQNFGREIQAGITFAIRRKAREQEARAATNFQHSSGIQRLDARHSFVYPDAHLLRGNWFAGIAAGPASQIEVARYRRSVTIS